MDIKKVRQSIVAATGQGNKAQEVLLELLDEIIVRIEKLEKRVAIKVKLVDNDKQAMPSGD
jgi:hypothetical protein